MGFIEDSVKGWSRFLKGEPDSNLNYDDPYYPVHKEPYNKTHVKEIVKSKVFFYDICLIVGVIALCMFIFQKGEWAGMHNMCDEDEKPAYDTVNEKYICWNENEELNPDYNFYKFNGGKG
tara:strand:- start:3965 stop:4324 length:360 start_codon:yes stop_codon:yes gene_type:complete